MKLWYQNLIESMMKENIADKGHLKSVMQYIEAIDNLHKKVLTSIQDKKYQEAYLKAKPHINLLMIKSGGEAKNEIHACLNGLYGVLLLKMKGQKISDETQEAIQQISKFLALLAQKYNEFRSGTMNLDKSQLN
jgi:c-di-AMP phosphodiesterase-like protein